MTLDCLKSCLRTSVAFLGRKLKLGKILALKYITSQKKRHNNDDKKIANADGSRIVGYLFANKYLGLDRLS